MHLFWYKHIKVKKNAIYYVKTQHANFQGNPLFKATKQHLNSEKLNVGYLYASGWAVLLYCFGVQCLEEFTKNIVTYPQDYEQSV